MNKPAVVLLSGGLDSATTLAMARDAGFVCHTLSFDYGQRHVSELQAAARLSQQMGAVEHKVIRIGLDAIGGSALTDDSIAVPDKPASGIPVTYVPARNTVFLAFALGWAEVLGSLDIFIGVNAVDYSGYPDCRPAFIRAFCDLAKLATRAGIEGAHFEIHTPLMMLGKDEIIRRGVKLGVNYGLTVSCYSADVEGRACGVCDACRLRRQGFESSGIPDPTLYF